MSWPQATDYNAAVQNPLACFGDADLRQGQAVGDMLGLPRPHSGNFADVYQVQCPGGQSWAVKCFTREIRNLHNRYLAISAHLDQAQRIFMVDFRYLDDGMRIRGDWFPILKMRWVEGFRLNEFVAEHLDRPVIIERLCQMWLKLAQELREAGMAHGDLQHGNVLLVPGPKTGLLSLRLIDYDGLYVPALADQPSGEVGHPHYQHPQRLREGTYNAEIDRFSHLVIYTALRCLRLGGKVLWDRHDNGENLLFRESDFRNPSGSKLLRELWSIADADVRALVGRLVLTSQNPLPEAPLLDELMAGNRVVPLAAAEDERVRDILGVAKSEGRGARSAERGARIDSAGAVALVSPDRQPVAVLEAPESLPETTATLDQTKPRSSPRLRAAPAVAEAAAPALLPPQVRGRWGAITDFVLTRPWVVPVTGASLLLVVVLGIALLLPKPGRRDGQPAERPPPAPRLLPDVTLPAGDTKALPLPIHHAGANAAPPATQKPKAESQIKPKPEDQPNQPRNDPPPAAQNPKPETRNPKAEDRRNQPAIDPPGETRNPKPETRNLKTGDRPNQPGIDPPPAARRPPPASERVDIPTGDGVMLHGRFYPGPEGTKSNGVLLVPDLATRSAEEAYGELARALQNKGLAVLTFDFRGHNQSLAVQPLFWKLPHNLVLNKGTKPGPKADQLRYMDIPVTYFPHMVNDIMAARTYLELRNDKHELNASNLVVVGAGKGAGLAATWLAWEWSRVECDPSSNQPPPGAEPQGSTVVGAVWLGLDPVLTARGVPAVETWLRVAGQEHLVPMLFLYGSEDRIRTTRYLEHARVGNGTQTHGRLFPDTRAVGLNALKDVPAASEEVLNFVTQLFEHHELKPWRKLDFESKKFKWMLPGFSFSAKEPGARQLAPVPVDRLMEAR